VLLTKPQSYMEFLNLWKDAALIMTDSGGLQEETTALGIPCLTLRENTERPVTADAGGNVRGASLRRPPRCWPSGQAGPPPGAVGRQGRRAIVADLDRLLPQEVIV
jgi:UDP-N-acetylglucosamine 2-epimerase (non-hydrolysing)